ncbi:hypothetical protein [Geodermatophilus ruber]|uniref:EthD domain-containing protein n=1 Tax=Geodermatophilus ruber TaxID=504800 RepID=A0A1I4KKN3_9ACTN|nr:hypothetical protein [Geodermatophilus ruber]SFL79133.1 hypothetical protein SAMN04488085_11814 [Geodermatophilus ruber]
MHTPMAPYRPPADRAAFNRHCGQVHLPLAQKLPGVRAAHHSLDAAGEAAGADIPNFATSGLEILHFPARAS